MDEQIEKAFVRSFVYKSKRERAIYLLQKNIDTRNYFIHYTCKYIDPLFVDPINDNIKSYVDIYRIISTRHNNVPKFGYVMSNNKDADGMVFPLEIAVFGWPCLISCVNGKLAYFEAEGGTYDKCSGSQTVSDRGLLVRRNNL